MKPTLGLSVKFTSVPKKSFPNVGTVLFLCLSIILQLKYSISLRDMDIYQVITELI